MVKLQYLLAAAERGLVNIKLSELCRITGYSTTTVREALRGSPATTPAVQRSLERALGLADREAK